MDTSRASEREHMVRTQILARGVSNPLVLEAMRTVPRHLFVPQTCQREAYADYPLPIGSGQTISQPYIVAVMTELLNPNPGDLVLEIGTGSGYQAAILATCGADVVSIERIEEVAAQARQNLQNAGIKNVRIITGDGTVGYTDMSPYDGILITAGTPEVPCPLINELAPGGRLVAPVGDQNIQELIRITQLNNEFITEKFGAVRFVPLIGEFGWKEEGE